MRTHVGQFVLGLTVRERAALAARDARTVSRLLDRFDADIRNQILGQCDWLQAKGKNR